MVWQLYKINEHRGLFLVLCWLGCVQTAYKPCAAPVAAMAASYAWPPGTPRAAFGCHNHSTTAADAAYHTDFLQLATTIIPA